MTPNEQTAAEALKPCPFCGGEAEYSNYGPDGQMIVCYECSAIIDKDTKDLAIAAWNRRTLLEASPTVPVSRDDWDRGFYCAVAQLIKEEGLVTSATRSLYLSGGNPENADEEDKKVFIEHGLMQS